MAYDLLWKDEFALGYRDQSDYDTLAGSPSTNAWLAAEDVKISLERQIFEGRKAVGIPGAGSKRGVGGRKGTLSFRHLMRSQTPAFNGDSTAPTFAAPELDLLEEIIGASAVGTAALTVKAAPAPTAKAWDLSVGTPSAMGAAYAFGTTKTAVKGINWLKTATSPTTYQQDARALPVTGDKVYPMRTAYPVYAQPTAKTFDLVGEFADAHVQCLGCVPSGVTFEIDPGGQLYCEFSYTFTDMIEGSAGGIAGQSPDRRPAEYLAIPTFLGVNNARVVMGGNVVTSFFDGTADADGQAALTSLRIMVSLEQTPIEAHHGRQGVHDVKIRRRLCKIEFTAPKASEFVVSSKNIFTNSLDTQSGLFVEASVGTAAGALFSFFAPSAVVVAETAPDWTNDRFSYKVSMEAMDGGTTTDETSAQAGQKPFRVAFG